MDGLNLPSVWMSQPCSNTFCKLSVIFIRSFQKQVSELPGLLSITDPYNPLIRRSQRSSDPRDPARWFIQLFIPHVMVVLLGGFPPIIICSN